MLLNIVKAKAECGKLVPVEVNLNLNDDLISYKGYKFLTPASVKGEMIYESEKLLLKAKVSVKLLAVCDSCGESFEKNIVFDIEETFIENYNSNSEEDYLINQTNVEIDKPIIDNLILNIPTKMLCKKSCKGLCPICGKNKNLYSCNCVSLQGELESQENPFNQLKNRR